MARLLGSSGQVFLRGGPNTAIGAPLGFEAGTGLSSLTTSLASGLSNLGDATNIGAEVAGAAGLGLSASMWVPISGLYNDGNQHTDNPARFIASCGGIAIATSKRLLRPKREDC